MKRFLFALALALMSWMTQAQQTNLTPLNRAFLQSDLNGNGKQGTNFGTLRATNFIDAVTGLPIGGGGGTNAVANVFTTNLPGAHGVQAADVGTAAYVSTNFSLKLMSPQAGNVALDDMAAATSDHVGQLGLSWPGSKTPGLWFAASVGTGSNAWNRAPWNFFSGFGQIGHYYAMPSSLSNLTASGIRFIQNGNASDQSYYAATNSNSRNGSGFYHYNMNPYSDGNFLSLPMVTTNVALATGGAVSTNADGAKIYIRDPFGFTLDSIPSEYIQGETNQAGSLAFIAGISHDLPFYISANMNGIPGETVSGYSQHDWVCFDQRYLLDNSKPLGVHFPMQVPYAWHVTNALRKDTLFVDERPGQGHVFCWSNFYLGGGIMATQQTAMKASIFGPNWADSGNGLALLVTTNAHFGGNNDIMTTFDFQNFHRLGIGKIGVNYPKHYHASGAPWTISRSSAADLQTLPLSGQTITDEVVIDSSGNINMNGNSFAVSSSSYLAGATTHSNNVTVAAAYTITATNVGASKLAGTDAAGQFTNIVVGSGLSLSAGQLTATAASASVISNSASQMADSNVKVATISDGDVLTYVLSDHRWTNKPSVGGGDVTKSGNNPFTGSNNFAGLTLFSNNGAMDAASKLYLSNLTASRAVFTDAGKGLVSAAASGAVPMDGDGTATTKAQIITLVGDIVTNGYTPAITLPEAAAPSTPAANNQSIYADSTSHNLAAKNSSGTVNHMVQSKAFSTHQWLTAIADDGSVSQSQPAFTDITGSVAAGQLPALTGAVTTSAGSAATSLGSFSSANLSGALTDETGSGPAVFATSPTLTTPTIGVATATSVNKWTLTAPTTAATLTAGADNLTYTMPSSSQTMVGRTSTDTLQNKTIETTSHGGNNTLKAKAYIQLKNFDNITGAKPNNTNDYTVSTFMKPVFLNGTAATANFIQFQIQVPTDFDTSVDPKIKITDKLTAADTGVRRYIVSTISPAASAAYDGTVGTAINVDIAADASGASGDVEQSSQVTLTGWGAALTPGRHWVIQIGRDGNSGTDTSTVDSMFSVAEIEYAISQ